MKLFACLLVLLFAIEAFCQVPAQGIGRGVYLLSPAADGTNGQPIVTNGSATLSFGAITGTGSFAMNTAPTISNVDLTGTTALNGVTYTWPGTDGGAGEVLSTNGAGTLSWTAAGGGGDTHFLNANLSSAGSSSWLHDFNDSDVGWDEVKQFYMTADTGAPGGPTVYHQWNPSATGSIWSFYEDTGSPGLHNELLIEDNEIFLQSNDATAATNDEIGVYLQTGVRAELFYRNPGGTPEVAKFMVSNLSASGRPQVFVRTDGVDQGTATNGQYLQLVDATDGEAEFATISALQNIVEDTTPQLGGNLDINAQKIVSTANGNIDIEPNGTGNVLLGNFTFDADQTIGAGQDNFVLTYDNGTGLVSLEVTSALQNIVEDVTPQLGGNLDVNAQKIVSTANGNIDIEPNGTGNVLLGNFTFDADQTIGAGQDNFVLTYDNGSGLVSLETAGSGTDGSAIHDNVAAEISAITEKVSPASADLLIIEDSADSNNKKKVQIGNLPGGGGGGALTITTTSSDANVTGLVDEKHIITQSAYTADRDYTLPATAAVGDRCGVGTADGNATYEILIKSGGAGDKINNVDHSSTEWSRLFIAGEQVTFVCVDAAGPHWIVEEDGRIPCKVQVRNPTGQSVPNNTETKVEFDTTDYDVGSCIDLTNERFVARRGGTYTVNGSVAIPNLDSGEFLLCYVALNGTNQHVVRDWNPGTNNTLGLTVSIDLEASSTDYFEIFTHHNEGAAQTTGTSLVNQPKMWVKEIL